MIILRSVSNIFIHGGNVMKKEYIKPIIEGEEFIANEYVAACWTVWCNVPYGYAYFEKNGVEGYQKGEDEYIVGPVIGDDVTHTAKGIDAEGPKANAMYQNLKKGGLFTPDTPEGDPYEVFYWQLPPQHWGDTGHHFSKVSDAKWEKNPNASN